MTIWLEAKVNNPIGSLLFRCVKRTSLLGGKRFNILTTVVWFAPVSVMIRIFNRSCTWVSGAKIDQHVQTGEYQQGAQLMTDTLRAIQDVERGRSSFVAAAVGKVVVSCYDHC